MLNGQYVIVAANFSVVGVVVGFGVGVGMTAMFGPVREDTGFLQFGFRTARPL